MRLPAIRGVIDRRVLVNFRVDANILSRVCPPPFRPQTVDGFGVAGICLIRLKSIRPKRLPAWIGLTSENAAHRIAVEWEVDGVTRSGVYIPRRDTSSYLNVFAGGRMFPGVHHHARFHVQETENDLRIAMDGVDGSTRVRVQSRIAEQLPSDSIFETVDQCSQFFEAGSLGYSPTNSIGGFDGVELRTENWQVQPLAVTLVQSSFFDDPAVFPKGAVVFDNALLMRGIDHEWHIRGPICCVGDSVPPT